MDYFKGDFTEENYRRLLKKITYDPVFYTEIDSNDKYTLLRHDVDFSVHRAYALSVIEREERVKSTYFFQLGNSFYNIFEDDIRKLIVKIKKLGHKIALHFDPTQYEINSKDDLEKYLNFEKNILENLFMVDVEVFSFYNPTHEILKFDEYKYANMVNTYARFFAEDVPYCSDSNGYWRHDRLEEFLDRDYHKSQILTHPGWWQEKVISPRSRIRRCINGRANNVYMNYSNLLDTSGRENVK